MERVTVTVPRHLLLEADRVAAQLGRSRSWVLSEALRRMLDADGSAASRGAGKSEPAGADGAEAEAARISRLRKGLRLRPEERLLAAEELVQLGRMVRPQRWRRQILSFDSYEEYSQWKTASRAGA